MIGSSVDWLMGLIEHVEQWGGLGGVFLYECLRITTYIGPRAGQKIKKFDAHSVF